MLVPPRGIWVTVGAFWCHLRGLWVTLQQPDDGRVAFGTLDELFQREFSVHVFVHLSKDLVCSLLWRGLILWHFHHRAHHFIDGGDDLEHLLPCDEAITIKVIHGEGPFQLLLQLSPGGDRQGTKELAEVNASITICVKSSKHMLRKFGGITIGEKVSINLLELLH